MTVVGFKNLNIGLVTENLGSQFRKLKAEIDACGKIGGHTDGAAFGGGNNLGSLLLIHTCGTHHHLLVVGGTEGSIGNSGNRGGKVDQHIKLVSYLFQ